MCNVHAICTEKNCLHPLPWTSSDAIPLYFLSVEFDPTLASRGQPLPPASPPLGLALAILPYPQTISNLPFRSFLTLTYKTPIACHDSLNSSLPFAPTPPPVPVP
jgi:hypothetical protein